MWLRIKQDFLICDLTDGNNNEQIYLRLSEGPFYKDKYLINMIYLFHNLYIISIVLVYAICFYDTTHLIWQI